MRTKKLRLPANRKAIANLKCGDNVLLTGTIFTARDATHRLIIEAISNGKKLPFRLKNQAIYYTGPTPAKPGKVIGSAGPTTSSRMDSYTFPLLKAGVNCMIGKGQRSQEVRELMKKYGAVYMAVVGGAGALISKTIKSARPVAFENLGPEAVFELHVENLPAVVINDIRGGDLYAVGKSKYRDC